MYDETVLGLDFVWENLAARMAHLHNHQQQQRTQVLLLEVNKNQLKIIKKHF